MVPKHRLAASGGTKSAAKAAMSRGRCLAKPARCWLCGLPKRCLAKAACCRLRCLTKTARWLRWLPKAAGCWLCRLPKTARWLGSLPKAATKPACCWLRCLPKCGAKPAASWCRTRRCSTAVQLHACNASSGRLPGSAPAARRRRLRPHQALEGLHARF